MSEHQNIDKARPGKTGRHKFVALALSGLVAGMLGMSYAAVPLYQLFCQVTGYGGTTQRADKAPDRILEKVITVRFDANLSKGLDWKFRPQQRTVELKIGETALAHYEAENIGQHDLTGTATFNVSPDAAGRYFNKIECFCFTEQVLTPGQRVDMPVTFFVDPEFATDPDTRNIKEITLSYTFFEKKKPGGDVANSSSAKKSKKQGSKS